MQTSHNPRCVTCLANLSNDEVFTPPELVNQILDLLPKKLWKDKNAKFLDPVTSLACSARNCQALDYRSGKSNT